MIDAESFLYSLLAFSSAMFLLIILFNDKSFLDKKNKIHISYISLLGWTVLSCFIESLIGLFLNKIIINDKLYFFFESCFYIFTAIASTFWLNYVMAISNLSKKRNYAIRWYGLFTILVQLVLIIINSKNNMIFSITDHRYCDGKYFYVIFIIQFTVYAISGFKAISVMFKYDYNSFRFFLSFCVFIVFPLCFGFSLLFFYGIPSFSLGYMFSICLIHFFLSVWNQKVKKDELENAKNQAENANKAKSIFLFNMSHDIRTPLNAITGYLELISKNTDDKQKINEYLDKAKKSSDNLLALINNILEFARIENGKIEIEEIPCDLSNSVEYTLQELDLLAKKKNITLIGKAEIFNPYIKCDIVHTGEIVTNILSNALKYTPSGGKVEFIQRQLPCEDKNKCIFEFTCKDNGIGMSKEFISHAFDNFERERTSANYNVQGTGLGLGIVKKLTDLMNGTVEIQSEVGKGTTITTRFIHDFCSKDEVVGFGTDNNVNVNSLKGRKCLLVEDNEFNMEIAQTMLSDNGLIVDTASNGKSPATNFWKKKVIITILF